MGMRPLVVASPSMAAINKRLKEEMLKAGQDDITSAFDPYRGLHRPKGKSQLLS